MKTQKGYIENAQSALTLSEDEVNPREDDAHGE